MTDFTDSSDLDEEHDPAYDDWYDDDPYDYSDDEPECGACHDTGSVFEIRKGVPGYSPCHYCDPTWLDGIKALYRRLRYRWYNWRHPIVYDGESPF